MPEEMVNMLKKPIIDAIESRTALGTPLQVCSMTVSSIPETLDECWPRLYPSLSTPRCQSTTMECSACDHCQVLCCLSARRSELARLN